MNDIALTLGVESWKPVFSALLLPPLPLLVLILFGTRHRYKRPLLGWLMVLLGVAGVWLSCTPALAQLLMRGLIKPPPVLVSGDVAELKRSPKTAILVLGGGRRLTAPEYGVSTLNYRSAERLRYGLWLARETGLPLGYSGGVGHGALPGPSEAEAAARVAEREYGRPLRWREGESRDTRENATRSIALLQPQGIEKIVLVTEAVHMPRALRNFERAAEGKNIRILPAPMGPRGSGHLRASDWLPGIDGYEGVCLALHEWLGRMAGA